MDEIQKSILRLKAELQEKPPIYINIMYKCPAFIPAAVIIAGIIFQYHFHIAPVWLLTLCTGLSAGFLILAKFGKARLAPAKMLLAILCFACLGSVRLSAFEKIDVDDIRNFVSDEPRFVHIKAEITTEPLTVLADDWQMAKFSRVEPYTVFYAKPLQIKTIAGWADVSGRMKFYTGQENTSLQIGDEIQSFCKIKTFSPADNPGQYDYKKTMNRRGIYVCASVKNSASIQILTNSRRNILARIQTKLRQFARLFLNFDIESEDSGGLLDALLLGQRTKIAPNIYDAFKKTGLLHLISLSGLHVGIFAGIVWWAGKKTGLTRSSRAMLCVFAIAVFIIIVPARTPTIRAAIMFLTFCTAEIFKKRVSAFNSLALAAIIITLIRPMDIFSVGFSLSFAAVSGILLFYKPINQKMVDNIEKIKSPLLRKPLLAVTSMVIVGLCAWLGTAGILVLHFNEIQPACILWTAAAMPFIVVILPLGFIKILLASVLPSLAHFLAIPLQAITDLFIFTIKTFAQLSPAPIVTGHINILIILLYYATLSCGTLPWNRYSGKYYKAKKLLCTVGVIVIVLLVWQFNFRPNTNTLSLNILSVGHGQCIVAVLPGEKTIIFDCGSISKNNVGERIVTAFLNYAGLRDIESVYLSHNDIDHFNGIPEVAEQRKIKNVYMSEKFIAQTNSSKIAAVLVNFLTRKNIPIEFTPQLKTLGKVTIKKIWPVNEELQDLSDNDSSTVLLIEYANRKIMLCSDIGKYAQEKVMKLYPELDVDVITSPHHGSQRDAVDGFEQAFKPEYAVTSCSHYQSQRNPRGKNFLTSDSGCITIKISSTGKINIATFK
ncbi:MAG: DNA internalization-related competence protein ComEC/Rec2 [Anaerohalosphaeraceae bacterium]|nr:DNA internalization-related competence protein ComEC/Rec2 [Anaerohalosphaeraceae bacterium]